MLLDPKAVFTAIETLRPEDFYSAGHRLIFEAMQELYSAMQPIDLVTVMDKLEQKGTLEKAGGMAYLAELSKQVPTTANAAYYVSIVEDRSVLRGVISAGSEMVSKAFEADKPADEVVSDAHDLIYNLAVRKRTDSLVPIRTALLSAYDRINAAASAKGGLTGTPTGYADLNALTSGFEPGQLIVLAGRPGKGKTSLALNIAMHVALKCDMPVAVFSLEMSSDDIALRLMCARAEVSMQLARMGLIGDGDYEKLLTAMTELANAPIYIDSSGSATVNEIRARCMRLSAQKRLGLIVIDYLQLMSGGKQKTDSRQQEISEMTRALKLMARDLGTPVMILSQLNRDIERRGKKRPILADLRESGSIEQDADIVIFLSHYSDLEDEEDVDADSVQNGAKAIVAKNRNGATGDVELRWLAEYTKFVGVSDREESK
jgi:replicative DNA helicase